MDENRLKHSLAVANKMVEIGKEKNLSEKELDELFLLGYLHDVGCQFRSKGPHHVAGADVLKESGYPYWKEVYYHGIPTDEYQSLYLDILNIADMSIDKYGNDVGFASRLEDIKGRYGEESKVYQNCVQLIEELKKKM